MNREISKFIEIQLNDMVETVKSKFPDNMASRKNNPFLVFSNKDINKYMALGRSIDSQLGNRIQKIIFYLSRKKYGDFAVPNIITIDIVDEPEKVVKCRSYYVPLKFYESDFNKNADKYRQTIYIKQNLEFHKIKQKLKLKKASHALKYEEAIFKNVTDDIFDYIKNYKKPKVDVDLIIIDFKEKLAETYEIKMSGNLDTKNAPSNVKEVKMLKNIFDFMGYNKSFFATCYGSPSSSILTNMKLELDEKYILNNKMLWDRVLPSEIGYDIFIEMYQKAFKKSKIEKMIKEL